MGDSYIHTSVISNASQSKVNDTYTVAVQHVQRAMAKCLTLGADTIRHDPTENTFLNIQRVLTNESVFMVEFFPQNSKEKNQNKLLNYEETKKKIQVHTNLNLMRLF